MKLFYLDGGGSGDIIFQESFTESLKQPQNSFYFS